MVDLVSELKYTKSPSGLEAMIGADSDVSIRLVGSNNEQFQAISENFYQQMVERLKAQGIEVVPVEELKALPEFTELAANGITLVSSEQDAAAGKDLFFNVRGLPLQLSDEKQFIPTFSPPFTKPKKDDLLTFGTRFSGGFPATTECECRVQPESFDKALLGHQLAVAQRFGEKMRNPASERQRTQSAGAALLAPWH